MPKSYANEMSAKSLLVSAERSEKCKEEWNGMSGCYYNPCLFYRTINPKFFLTKPLLPGAETRHRDLLQPDQGAPLQHQEEAV